MEAKLSILQPFFKKSGEAFHIREVAKLTGINHTTVRKYLQEMVKENILAIKEDKLYDMYIASHSLAFHNIQLYYILESVRKSKFLADIEKNDKDAAVVLLNSFKSDDSIELCVIYQKNNEYSVKELEKYFGKKIVMHYHNAKKFHSYLKNDALLFQHILNGIVIKGKITVADFL
ncbi:hypothetical protein HZA96_03970 [Candidatus Woesearchaeota archaeon]|nr:hypothetical protein [Candidatus Woesearchaeota archaeon]